MSLASTLARYLSTNANVVQKRMTRIGSNKMLVSVNGTDGVPLQLSIWPLTKMWKMHGGGTYEGARLLDQFQGAISDVAYDIQAGDVLIGYPTAGVHLEVATVNIYDDGTQPLPHLGLMLRRYSHTG